MQLNSQMETAQTESLDMKMWIDIENFMQEFPSDDLSAIGDLVQSGESSHDHLFSQPDIPDLSQIKSEIYSYQSDASLYDDRQLQQQQQDQRVRASLEVDLHLTSECDPFVSSIWSDMKLWDSDPSLVHIKEEQTPSLTSDVNLSGLPEVAAKVYKASVQLGISSDPHQWSVSEIRKWAEWVLERCGLSSYKHVIDNLVTSGAALCDMRLEDLKNSFELAGESLFIELELWKCVQQLSWPHASTQTPATQFSNNYVRILPSQTSTGSSLPLEISNIPSIQTFSTFTGLSAVENHTNENFACARPPQDHFVHSQAVRPNTLAVLPSYFLGADVHHRRRHHHHQQPQHLSSSNDPVLPQFSYFISPSSNSYTSSPSSSSSVLDFNYSNFIEIPASSTNPSPTLSIPDFYEGAFGSQSDISEKAFSEVPVQPTRQGNQLWQFLKELLLQPCAYESCIRWLDRSKGIFKIEDSIKVAKLWGQRKNRPAMNYDKLSRSIRQYYKKGIIKKTSQSKRLVYQFCQKYA